MQNDLRDTVKDGQKALPTFVVAVQACKHDVENSTFSPEIDKPSIYAELGYRTALPDLSSNRYTHTTGVSYNIAELHRPVLQLSYTCQQLGTLKSTSVIIASPAVNVLTCL
jgi:hypothetical protein